MVLNCGIGENSWESLGLQEIQPVHHKGDQSRVFFGRNDAKAETPVLWPPHVKSWLIGKDSDRGWDGWMASPTRWTWVWMNSRSWWWTGRPGVLRFMGSQRVGHDRVTEVNWTDWLLGRKIMTNLDSILKSIDITLPTRVYLVKAMDFQVVMYERESWTVKKPEHWRIDAFELWCWRGLLRVPWTTGDPASLS